MSKNRSEGVFEKLKRERWQLFLYDLVMLLASLFLMFYLHPSEDNAFRLSVLLEEAGLCAVTVFLSRLLFGCYRQIIRYGGQIVYIRLIAADAAAAAAYLLIGFILFPNNTTAIRRFSVCGVNLLLCLTMRLVYQYMFQQCWNGAKFSGFYARLIRLFSGTEVSVVKPDAGRIRIALVGAGRVGASLAEDISINSQSQYRVICFLDSSVSKTGRYLSGYPVYSEEEADKDFLDSLGIQEVVIAVPTMDAQTKRDIYEKYRAMGYGVKIYDYPVAQNYEKDSRRQLREFDVEELLFRPKTVSDYNTVSPFYRNRSVLITGGGGSIGSEIARQVAKMGPKELVILDISENSAYSIQQELKQIYGTGLNLSVVIANICDEIEMEKAFAVHRPDIVVHAAAHKHVPLMEDSVCEAVKNNIFGTKVLVDLSIRHGVDRFLMVSTDKAVNPTNVMGATKRVCEMIVMNAASKNSGTKFCATRFGNVLGSSGSVIPLFRKQIENGGPVTVTDKRIVRYFMTIPEACALVLTAASFAGNGELFVLDMGEPVRILDLAVTMVKLSGLVPYKDIDIVETGLRPGEKLYEEILVDKEKADTTEHEKIFCERDDPLSDTEIEEKLKALREAVLSGSDDMAREALHRTVPTFRNPEEVNPKQPS